MAIKVASISSSFGKDVFTNKGMYCGKVEDVEADLKRFKVRSLVVRAAKESYISRMLGDKKGVIIPYPMVETIGDIIIIKHISLPAGEESPPEGGAHEPVEEPRSADF
jgi:sporulation protein YlmC with PRC-barrel domain